MRHTNRTTYAVAVKDGKKLLYRHEELTATEAQHYIGHYTMLSINLKLDFSHFIAYCPDQKPVSVFVKFVQDE